MCAVRTRALRATGPAPRRGRGCLPIAPARVCSARSWPSTELRAARSGARRYLRFRYGLHGDRGEQYALDGDALMRRTRGQSGPAKRATISRFGLGSRPQAPSPPPRTPTPTSWAACSRISSSPRPKGRCPARPRVGPHPRRCAARDRAHHRGCPPRPPRWLHRALLRLCLSAHKPGVLRLPLRAARVRVVLGAHIRIQLAAVDPKVQCLSNGPSPREPGPPALPLDTFEQALVDPCRDHFRHATLPITSVYLVRLSPGRRPVDVLATLPLVGQDRVDGRDETDRCPARGDDSARTRGP